jgi:hypothetical protein
MAALAKVDEVELALSRCALGVHSQMYKGVKVPELEPQRKTLMHDAWHGKNLSARHQKAWRITVDLFRDAVGISPPSSMFAERIGGGGDGSLPIPRAGQNYQQDRIEYLMGYFLHKHQRVLLHRLLIEHFQSVKSGSLAELGKQMSGYADTAQSRAAGVTSMQRLLDSLAEFHGI